MTETYSLPKPVVTILKRAYVHLGYAAVSNPIATPRDAEAICNQIERILEKYRWSLPSNPEK